MTDNHDYDGMTVNERLWTAGLLDAFGRAARARDRQKMLEILASVDVPDPETADAIIANPRKYGY